MVAMFGLIIGLALLIWLALRDVNIIFAAVLCSLIVIVSNGLPFAEILTQSFTIGELGAFTFAGRFFLLFAAGAVFGLSYTVARAVSIAATLTGAPGIGFRLWSFCSRVASGGPPTPAPARDLASV